ncbi:LamG-like jellyroll fold domain-containing protein [Streptomyces bacillaris]|uniref:LamG-like jellyroll fold domain-containing protein n=1 Tax=Streptomyces bacillaris TaxID=68179 RepID=UPI0037FD3421
MRGASTEVFVTPEGDLEQREYVRPVRTRVDGEWKPVDTALVPTGKGVVVPKAVTVGLEFSGGGSGAPLVRMNKAGRELALSWPGRLPAPELDGATATYRNVLPDVDLRMGAQEDGFTQLLVVNSAAAAASPALTELRMKLAAGGMDVKETESGGLVAVDKGAGTSVFEAPMPQMWDSSDGADGGDVRTEGRSGLRARTAAVPPTTGVTEAHPAESGKLAPVGVELPPGNGELVLKPDLGVLRSKDTEYPVFIDPQWYSPRASAWTMASKHWASSPQWKFNGKSDAGMGYCGWDYCAPQDTKRLFYRLPTSTYAGKTVLSAEFVVRNVHSASCSAREVQLWRTKDISSSTTWNTQSPASFWLKKLAAKSFAHGYTGCAAKDAEFDVKAAVQEAANGKWSTMTFGLRASNESDRYGWKRFSDKAFLRVKYNRPPTQVKMSQLTAEYGGTCKAPAQAPRVRSLGKIYANGVTDPDGDDIAVEFQAYWDSGDGKGLIARWKPARTSYKKSGSSFSIGLPTSIPANRTVHWHVRSYDGAQYSPWSSAGDPTACYFVYDTSVPAAPAISSGHYPASDPENPDDPWYDGVGQYGTFSIDSPSTDVIRYRYGFNTDPSAANQITTTGGAAKSARLLPARPGLNFVTAQAFDQAGNGSEIRTYQFRVKAGQPERAVWQLDEPAGATKAAGTTTSRTVRLHGGAELGAEGRTGTGLRFDGTTGYAASDLTVVDTSDSFSVAAWARLDRMPSEAAIIAAQPGNHSPGFELYYSQYYDRWVFNQYTSDTAGASIARAMAPAAGGAEAGRWTHLVGVYDGKAKQLRLYVDGKLAGSTAYTTAWEARRGLQLGAGIYSGTHKSFFPGTIDDVRLFDRPVADDEVRQIFQRRPLVKSRWTFEQTSGTSPVTTPNAVSGGSALTLNGGAKKSDLAYIDAGGLELDGVGGYAATASVPVDTGASYTVTAWAQAAALPQRAASVVSAEGTVQSAFNVRFVPDASDPDGLGHWERALPDKDSTEASTVRVVNSEFYDAREWNHLAVVYDGFTKEARLYVNGVLQEIACGDGDGEADEAACGNRVSWSVNTLAFKATKSLQVGRAKTGGTWGDYFPGLIDDVWAFQGTLTDAQVEKLAGTWFDIPTEVPGNG